MDIKKLTDAEKDIILTTVDGVGSGKEKVAIAAYGSRIAGYARKDSDYDVLVVLKNYRPKVAYRYIKKDMEMAALIVDSDSLLKDAEEAFLGEFVVGRILNVYEPLKGKEYLEEVEKKYKRRIINETLDEIIADYRDFSSELLIPPKYFLLQRLKKRVDVYSPFLYSLVKTYYGKAGRENLNSTLEEFGGLLKELEDGGIVSIVDGNARIEKSYVDGKCCSKVLTVGKKIILKAKDATNVARAYTVHAYAGRGVMKVTGKEIMSKIKRAKKTGETPDEVIQPKNTWKIEEGVLMIDADDWAKKTAEYLGMDRNVTVTKRHLGGPETAVSLYTLDDGFRNEKIVVKNFKDEKSAKWILTSLLTIFTKRFRMSPLTRLHKEYTAIKDLRKFGFNTPQIVSVCLNERILATKFIEGTDLEKIVDKALKSKDADTSPIRLYGENLALVHAYGYTLGDTKPSNSMFSDGKIFFIDLEQAGKGGDNAWDVAEFVYYPAKFSLDTEGEKRVVSAFLEGYLKHGDKKVVKSILDLKYLAPFQSFIPPNMIDAIADEIRSKI